MSTYTRHVCFNQRRLGEAEAIYLDAQAKVIEAGSAPIFCFDIHQNLGNTYTHLGRFTEALEEYKIAGSIAATAYPPNHPGVAQLHRNRGELYASWGRLAEARAANEETLRIFKGCGDPVLSEAAQAHFSQAIFHAGTRGWDEAEYHLRLALHMQNEIYGEGHPATSWQRERQERTPLRRLRRCCFL